MSAGLRTVQNTLETPGTSGPVVGKTISIRLNTPGFIDDGTREKIRTTYATTDSNGQWSAVLEVNADIDPAGSYYTVLEPGGQLWAFIVPAGDPATPISLRDCLVVDPANPNPILTSNSVPPGGTTGQVLAKVDGGDFDTHWIDQAASGVSSVDERTGAVTLADLYTPLDARFNVKPSNVRQWRAGLAKAASGGSACELWIGDSIFGGCIDINGPVFDRLNAIPRAYERAMASKGVPTNGTGYVRSADNTHQDARWSLGAGWAISGSGTSIEASTSGAVCTFTTNVAGTEVAVLYYDFGTDPLHVSVNGATSGSNFAAVTLTGTRTWKRFAMTGAVVAAGDVITVTTTSATLAIVAAVEVCGPTGLAVHNVALSGSTAGGTGFGSWSDTSSGYDSSNIFGGAVYAETPCVVHMGLGYWDFTNGALAGWAAGVQAIRAQFPNSDFVLHRAPQPGSTSAGAWQAYLDAVDALALTLDCPVVDVQALLGGYTIEAANGQTGDTTAHLTVDAYNEWAASVAALTNAGGAPVPAASRGLVYPEAHGAYGDTREVFSSSTTSGSNVLEDLGAGQFVPADVGKIVAVVGGASGFNVLISTITGYTDAHHVTMADNATNTQSFQTATYGHDDTAALAATVAACRPGQEIVLTGYGYMTSQPVVLSGGQSIRSITAPTIYGDTDGSRPAIVAHPSFTGASLVAENNSTSGVINVNMLALRGAALGFNGTAKALALPGASGPTWQVNDVEASHFSAGVFQIGDATHQRLNVFFRRCSAFYAEGHDCWYVNTSDSLFEDCMGFGGANDWHILGMPNTQFVHCRAEHGGTAFYLDNVSITTSGVFIGCTSDQNDQDGFVVNGSQWGFSKFGGAIVLDGCAFGRDGNNSGAGGGSFAGLRIVNSAVPVIVTGTVVGASRGDSTGYGPAYGLFMSGNTAPVTITGGSFVGTVAGISDDGANTTISSTTVQGTRSASAETGSYSMPVRTLREVATTPEAGVALINGTQQFVTWTAPNDGKLHPVSIWVLMHVTSTTTGGDITLSFTAPDGTTKFTDYIFANRTPDYYACDYPQWAHAIVRPGGTISMQQATPLTAGAAVLWAVFQA